MKMATLPCINVATLTVIVQQNHFPNKQTPHKRMLRHSWNGLFNVQWRRAEGEDTGYKRSVLILKLNLTSMRNIYMKRCVVLHEDHFICICFSLKTNSILIRGSRYLHTFVLSNNNMSSLRTITCGASFVPGETGTNTLEDLHNTLTSTITCFVIWTVRIKLFWH